MADIPLVVDTPDLMDAVRKAATVSAARGAARDKAGGIQFEVQPPDLLIKATDLETTYRCAIPLVNFEGHLPDPFRLPAAILAKYLAQLPMDPGSRVTITFRNFDSKVQLECGASKATLAVIAGEFPTINAFDLSGLGEVDGLAHKLRQVQWACHPDSEPLSGVHIDGKRLIGCNQASLATVACEVPVDEPLTAPLGGVTAALRGHAGPMGLALQGRKLLLVPEPSTQFGTTTYATSYPDIDQVIAHTNSNRVTLISKELLSGALARINAMCSDERYPRLDIYIEGKTINLETHVDQIGKVEDVAYMEDELEYELDFSLNPETLATAVGHASSTTLLIAWPPESLTQQSKGFVRIEDGNGYLACLAPIKRL